MPLLSEKIDCRQPHFRRATEPVIVVVTEVGGVVKALLGDCFFNHFNILA